MKISYIIILYLICLTDQAFSETSLANKILNLRFGNFSESYAKNGEIELKDVFEESIFVVKGEAIFIPGAFMSPQFFSEAEWETIRDDPNHIKAKISTRPYPSNFSATEKTHGTYVMRVNSSGFEDWTIHPFLVYHPVDIFVAGTKHITQVLSIDGVQSNLGEPFDMKRTKAMKPFEAEKTFYIIVHAKSPLYKGKNTLNLSYFMIGPSLNIFHHQEVWIVTLGTFAGSFALMTFYYFFIFVFRSNEHSSLYLSVYSLLCFFSAFLFLFRISFSEIIMSQILSIKIFSSLQLGAVFFQTLYLFEKIRIFLSKERQKIIIIAAIIIFSSSILSQAVQIRPLINGTLLSTTLFNIIMVLYAMYLGSKHRIDGVVYLLTGCTLSLFFNGITLSLSLGLREGEHGITLFLSHLVMIGALGLVNAREFATSYHRANQQDQQNRRLLEDLKQQEKSRTLFFHNTSHELRTPLNGIIGFLDLVTKSRYGALPQAAQLQVSKALRLAEALKLQVNTILDLAKSKRGELTTFYQSFSLAELKTEADNLAEGLCTKSSELSYQSRLSAGDSSFLGDREKLYTIIRNLLGNAFKFRAPDRPNQVSLLLEADAATLRIEVRDTGIGIPEAFRDKIFEEFGQVQGDARRAYEGTGLGLTMVRDLVRLMGGSLHLDSELGKGTCFRVTIPRGSHEDQPLTTAHSTERPGPELIPSIDLQTPSMAEDALTAAQEGWTIMVIDDNETNCEVISDILRIDGYSVQHAISGRVGLEQMRRQRPDILLLDMMMPEMSGEDVIAVMRKDPLLQEIPVILVTARASEEDRILGLKLGADDYLPKPIFAAELRLRVRNMIERHRLLRVIERGAQQIKLQQLGMLFQEFSEELRSVLYEADGIGPLTPEDTQRALTSVPLSLEQKERLQESLLRESEGSSSPDRQKALVVERQDESLLLKRSLRQQLLVLDIDTLHLQAVWSEIRTLPAPQLEQLTRQLKPLIDFKQMRRIVQSCQELSASVIRFLDLRTDEDNALATDSWHQKAALLRIRARRLGVRWDTELHDSMLPIPAHILTQVFVNLTMNALEAIAALPSEERWIRIRQDNQPDCVYFTFVNGGQAIAPQHRDLLFQRGFTTKGELALGMGLFHSRRLLRSVGADIYYDQAYPNPRFIVEVRLQEEPKQTLAAGA